MRNGVIAGANLLFFLRAHYALKKVSGLFAALSSIDELLKRKVSIRFLSDSKEILKLTNSFHEFHSKRPING